MTKKKKTTRDGEQHDRAARLVKILTIMVSSPNGVTAQELADRSGRDHRTSLRDIKALERINVPIYRDGKLYKLLSGYTMPTLAFTRPETMAVLLAARLAVQHLDYNNEFLAMALNKLGDTLPKGPVKVFVGESVTQLVSKPENAERQKIFGVITQGLLDRKQITFTYVDSQGVESQRRVHPYFLEPIALMGRGTYLFGKDIDRGDIRVFKLDRILKAEVLPGDAYIPSDAKLQKLVADSWGVWTSDKVQKVELRFNKAAARRVQETVWHPSQTLTREKGGGVLMTLRVRGLVEVTPWILSWGADVEVLGPAELRKSVAATAAGMASNYS